MDELGCLDLLNSFHRVVVPEAVCEEVRKHRPNVFVSAHPAFVIVSVNDRHDAAVDTVGQVMQLHAGEREALLATRTTPESILLTDDAAARFAARTLGVQAHGTIGIVVRSIRVGQRTKDEALGILRSIRGRSTLFVSDRILDEVIAKVEQRAS